MKTKQFIAFAIIAIVFAAAGIYFGNARLAPADPTPDAVGKLLSQSLPDVTGKQESLARWKNRPLVVNFWATWCSPCVEEMPELSELQAEIASSNIQILGIGIDSASNIAQFASKYHIAYPVYTAGMEGSTLARELGNQAGGLPFTVLIGRDGQVKKTYLGRLKMRELREDLAAL